MHDNSSFLFVPADLEADFHVIRAKTPTLTLPLVPDAPPVPPLDSDSPTPVPPPDLLTDPIDDDDHRQNIRPRLFLCPPALRLPYPISTDCGGESRPAGRNILGRLQQTISRMRLANP